MSIPAPQEQPPAQNEQEARVDATCGSTNSPTASSSKPEADNASLWRGSECFRCRDVKGGIHYNLLTCQERNAMKALREMFPDGQADSLNFVLFSTSGVHGTYSLIEDAETDMLRGWKDEDGEDSEPSVTFAIIHPRVVAIRYGNCLPRTPDDIAFLKRLRASSQRQIMSIGMPGSPVADDAVDPVDRVTADRPRAQESSTPAPHQEQPDLRTAALALLERLREVHSDQRYQAVWQVAQLHIGPYEGPKYDEVMNNFADALQALPSTPPDRLQAVVDEFRTEAQKAADVGARIRHGGGNPFPVEAESRTWTAAADRLRDALKAQDR